MTSKHSKSMIVVGIETAGPNSKLNSITEICAISLTDPLKPFYEKCRRWKGSEHCQKPSEHFTLQPSYGKMPADFKKTMSKFNLWAKSMNNMVLAGYDIHNRSDFLRESFDIAKLEWPFGDNFVDLHSRAYSKLVEKDLHIPIENKISALTLDRILSCVGLPHKVEDCDLVLLTELETESFVRLLYSSPCFPAFEKYPLPDYLL